MQCGLARLSVAAACDLGGRLPGNSHELQSVCGELNSGRSREKVSCGIEIGSLYLFAQMKILFDHGLPFIYAHGGFQIQIEQTKEALEKIGVEVEYLRWWDDQQKGDIVHYFGRASPGHISFAHGKNLRFVMSELLTGQGSRSKSRIFAQRMITRILENCAPSMIRTAFRWESFKKADACIALTPWEAELMHVMFDAPKERLRVVPNGVEEIFFQQDLAEPQTPALPADFLVCTATVTERKRVLELAEAASKARRSLLVVGKPYAEEDPYYKRFLRVVSGSEGVVSYIPGVRDRAVMASIYRKARGFVLLSTMESLSLSALEAAACGLPLLLSDLPWARCTFGESASYCSPLLSGSETASRIAEFYDRAPSHVIPAKPLTWEKVARQLEQIYREVLAPPSNISR